MPPKFERLITALNRLGGDPAVAGRVIRNGRLVGRLHSLGHEIDGIFGTKLYAVKDSRRHR
jgi:hypothetical protein